MDFSKYIRDLQNEGKTNKSIDIEKQVVDYINTLDFSDPENIVEAENYIATFINDKIGKNEQVSRTEAKMAHGLATKIALQEAGHGDTRINYRPKTEKEGRVGAFYSDDTKSLTFFDENVCQPRYLLNPYGKSVEYGANSRMNYFNHQIYVINHEVQHVKQFNKKLDDPTNMSNIDYQIEKQQLSRIITGQKGSKYQNHADDLYLKNHDSFIFEIDADIAGCKGTLNLLKNVSPKAYEIACDSRTGNDLLNKLAKKENALKNQQEVMWNHETNPNNTAVVANHKATMINDEVLSLLNKDSLDYLFKNFSSLSLTYNTDGSKKTLEEVEKQRAAKMKAISEEQIPNDQKNLKRKQASQLFETIIESDPIYSFERSLQHIANAEYGSMGFVTDGGMAISSGPKTYQEVKKFESKASSLASYLEGVDHQQTFKIFNRYKNEIQRHSFSDIQNRNLNNTKRLSMIKIEYDMRFNKDLTQAKENHDKKQKEKNQKMQQEKQKALKVLKEVFPDFSPKPQIGKFEKDAVHVYQNDSEKLLLEHSIKQYMKDITNRTPGTNFVPISNLRDAINKIYDQPVSKESKETFDQQLKEGKIENIRNFLEPEKPKEARVEKISKEEIDKTREGLGIKKEEIEIIKQQNNEQEQNIGIENE